MDFIHAISKPIRFHGQTPKNTMQKPEQKQVSHEFLHPKNKLLPRYKSSPSNQNNHETSPFPHQKTHSMNARGLI